MRRLWPIGALLMSLAALGAALPARGDNPRNKSRISALTP
jgi:hypothetical protein